MLHVQIWDFFANFANFSCKTWIVLILSIIWDSTTWIALIFFPNLRLSYVLSKFLFFQKSEPQHYYKHGSYKKKSVCWYTVTTADILYTLYYTSPPNFIQIRSKLSKFPIQGGWGGLNMDWTLPFWAEAPEGRCPVEYRGYYVHPYILRPYPPGPSGKGPRPGPSGQGLQGL